MKKIILLFILLFLFSGCSLDPENNPADSASEVRDLVPSKKPGIPKPKLPQKALQANLLGAEKLISSSEDDAMDGLLERIDETIEKKNITQTDIERGWYSAREDEKKWGTPPSWIWFQRGGQEFWADPGALKRFEDIDKDKLCRETGGHYALSCLERAVEHCEYIPQSECRCELSTRWAEGQGCIVLNEKGSFIPIGEEDIQNGWYEGNKNQKKLDTPAGWIWSNSAEKPRWQNQPGIE